MQYDAFTIILTRLFDKMTLGIHSCLITVTRLTLTLKTTSQHCIATVFIPKEMRPPKTGIRILSERTNKSKT